MVLWWSFYSDVLGRGWLINCDTTGELRSSNCKRVKCTSMAGVSDKVANEWSYKVGLPNKLATQHFKVSKIVLSHCIFTGLHDT